MYKQYILYMQKSPKLKGTVSVISRNLPGKKKKQRPIPDVTYIPLNLYLINDVEDIGLFIGLNVLNSNNSFMFSCSKNVQITFRVINI